MLEPAVTFPFDGRRRHHLASRGIVMHWSLWIALLVLASCAAGDGRSFPPPPWTRGSDDEVGEHLEGLLDREFAGVDRGDKAAFLEALRAAPPGLRAMAATYELDVSLTLDDLAWHFGNWPDLELAEAARAGLAELGLESAAAVFARALPIVAKHHDELRAAAAGEDFAGWLRSSAYFGEMEPLDAELRAALGEGLVMGAWPAYARAHPERLERQ